MGNPKWDQQPPFSLLVKQNELLIWLEEKSGQEDTRMSVQTMGLEETVVTYQ